MSQVEIIDLCDDSPPAIRRSFLSDSPRNLDLSDRPRKRAKYQTLRTATFGEFLDLTYDSQETAIDPLPTPSPSTKKEGVIPPRPPKNDGRSLAKSKSLNIEEHGRRGDSVDFEGFHYLSSPEKPEPRSLRQITSFESGYGGALATSNILPNATSSQISSRTAALLASIQSIKPDREATKPPKSRKAKENIKTSPSEWEALNLDEPFDMVNNITDTEEPPKRKCPSKEKQTRSANERAQELAAEKEQKRLQKLAEKEAEKRKKEEQKEEKSRERQRLADLADVNRARIDKRVSSRELIAHIPQNIFETPLGVQIRSFLESLGVETLRWKSPLPNLIKWRRKVTSIYNESLGHWEPILEVVRSENHIICLLSANEFVEMATSDGDEESLDTHVRMVKSVFESCTLIYLIEGLTAWTRKNKNVRNRAFQASVLQKDSAPLPANQSKSKEAHYVNEDLIEDALLQLQMVHKCMIHHTATMIETAEWVSNFTQHISTIPYRTHKSFVETSICLDDDQVTAGKDTEDTYHKMLQGIDRVTLPVARSIAAEYPSVASLFEAMEKGGPGSIENLKRWTNANGTQTGNCVGPSVSRRLHNIFTSSDPNSNDV
ncbi:MAG: hypothetical protein M1829_005066 [Trizodia sp. TS-e1964]|nr:MAG: hypothetical protein M1829_005066 [Trizodia sp. TS-e1964]